MVWFFATGYKTLTTSAGTQICSSNTVLTTGRAQRCREHKMPKSRLGLFCSASSTLCAVAMPGLQPPAQVGTHHSRKDKLPKSLVPTYIQLPTDIHGTPDLFGVALLCAASLDGVCRVLGLGASQLHKFLTRIPPSKGKLPAVCLLTNSLGEFANLSSIKIHSNPRQSTHVRSC